MKDVDFATMRDAQLDEFIYRMEFEEAQELLAQLGTSDLRLHLYDEVFEDEQSVDPLKRQVPIKPAFRHDGRDYFADGDLLVPVGILRTRFNVAAPGAVGDLATCILSVPDDASGRCFRLCAATFAAAYPAAKLTNAAATGDITVLPDASPDVLWCSALLGAYPEDTTRSVQHASRRLRVDLEDSALSVALRNAKRLLGLTGNELELVEQLLVHGAVPISKLARLFMWTKPFSDDYNTLAIRVNKKLVAFDVKIFRKGSCARYRWRGPEDLGEKKAKRSSSS